ncbi:dephospho-CoA kinase [Anaerobaca lacustris]|uniref:Dephospho-CoA kinase n=1 Tax=Anaerobaca lacustris TaxID=3044600 RepID=A0AAW6U156_9BACT|nr:dephospho-CoA kinase [Sedimentisphaerales bacterium M17dextr]
MSELDRTKNKPVLGIVGGIASGKSAVAAEFGRLGCAVVDADAIARQALETPAIREAIVERFGPGVLAGAGQIDRRTLAEIVFGDTAKLQALNAIVHPFVLRRAEELIARHRRDPGVKAVVLDMPLLVEVGWADRCDRIVFVRCDRARRVERAGRGRSMDERNIEIRENLQISLDTKAALADNTIDNNSDFSALVRQVVFIFSEMTKNS